MTNITTTISSSSTLQPTKKKEGCFYSINALTNLTLHPPPMIGITKAACSIKLRLILVVVFGSIYLSAGNMLRDHGTLIRIPQHVWRVAATQHQEKVQALLQPGLTPLDHPLNSGVRRQYQRQNSKDWATALDPKNPVYNFLIEYYGLKGAKGTRRLSRWSPSPGLLLQSTAKVETIEQLEVLSSLYTQEEQSPPAVASHHGILLEGANEDDFGSTIHLRGASIIDGEGVVYSPAMFYGKGDDARRDENIRLSSPFLWYKAILQQTIEADPVLHCYGLHEWAMQYQPEGAQAPPSAKYQSHLQLRVSRSVINETVERKGVSCTHVDALRFFAQDALPLNKFGGPLERSDQVRLEQPACVHAHMDLLKVALKLTPFGDPVLLQRVLEVGLEARKLDVAASPYDATEYGLGVVPVDTSEGRSEYRSRQRELMAQVAPVRRALYHAYSNFLRIAFNEVILEEAGSTRLPSKKKQTAQS